jgi:hypothetical protein
VVIEHIEETLATSPKVALVYSYFDYKDRARQTPEGVLAELIKQLEFQRAGGLADMPLLPPIQQLYDNFRQKGKRPFLPDFRDALLSVSCYFEVVYLVFDAMDECDLESQRSALSPLITGLPLAKNNFKIMVTGRPYCADLQEAFELPAALELSITADNGDMELAVKEKIKKAKEMKRANISAELENKIVSAVMEKAAGM